jgi:hypothetical protein
VQEEALRDAHARHGQQRARQLEQVLADDQREDHQHGVDLRRVADDLRVQEVRLELVDSDDPREHGDRGAHALREADRHDRDARQDRSEDRHERHHGGDDRQNGPVFEPEHPEADRREQPVHQADQKLAAHDAREPTIEAREELVEAIAIGAGHERAEEVDDPLARHHQVRREHQRDEEHEDAAADRRQDGATDADELHRVLLAVVDRPREHAPHVPFVGRIRRKIGLIDAVGAVPDRLHLEAAADVEIVRPVLAGNDAHRRRRTLALRVFLGGRRAAQLLELG